MPNKPAEQQEQSQPESRAGPMPSGAERVFVRLTLWQTVIGVASVIIAVLALYAALTESAAVRNQTAAAVWPFVQFSVDDYDSETAASFRLSFTNAGVGPARMHDVRLVIGGQPVRDWQHAVKQVGGSEDARVGRSFVNNRVIRPDESIAMISTDDPDLARRFQAEIANPANSISYCYCSIFDSCWLADSRRDLQNPEPVDECPDFGETAYRN